MSLFRKIFSVAFMLGVLFLVFWGYRYFRNTHQPVGEAMEAVPGTAGLVFETNDLDEVWEKLSETNIMWEALQQAPYFRRTDTVAEHLDSLIRSHQELENLLQGQQVVFSAHMSGARTYDLMAAIAMPGGMDQKKLIATVRELVGEDHMMKRNYDGVPLYEAEHPEHGFAFAVEKSLFLCSRNPMLVEEAIRHLHSGTPLPEQAAFQKVRKTAGRDVDGNLYLNYQELLPLLATNFNDKALSAGVQDVPFAKWAELDLTLKPDALMLNGFTYAEEGTRDFLNILRDQEPQDVELPYVLPSHTAFLFYYGIGDPQRFLKARRQYLEKNNRLYEYNKALKRVADSCRCDPGEMMLSWMGNEVGVAVTELSKGDDVQNNMLTVVRTTDPDGAREKLKALEASLSDSAEAKNKEDTFRDVTIRRFPVGNIFRTLLGSPFPRMANPWYILLDGHVILAANKGALRDVINAYQQDQTLAKNIDFDSFTENLSRNANLFLYSNIGRSPFLYSKYLEESRVGRLTDHLDLFRQFQAVGLQFISSGDGLFYNNLYLEYDPVYKKETTSLWEVGLDTAVRGRPRLVRNHYTDALEVFVQDANNKVYLISNTGKVLWSKQLPEPIMGKVHQVDVYKNEKLQLLFNTRSRLYLLDRKGRDVENFPVDFRSPATSPLALFDYANTRDYRILVPCKDRHVYNYDKTGEQVEGWEFGKTATIVQRTPHHIRINTNNKDFIFLADSAGNIHLLDRRGNPRYEVERTITPAPGSDLTVDEGKTIGVSELVFTDTSGQVVKLAFNGEKEEIDLQDNSPRHAYRYKDVDGDGRRDHIFLDQNQLSVYAADKERLFEEAFDSTLVRFPSYFRFPDETVRMGVVNRKTHEAYLLNKFGSREEGMPLFGSTLFSIGDINKDGTFEVVIGHSDGNIYTYTLE